MHFVDREKGGGEKIDPLIHVAELLASILQRLVSINVSQSVRARKLILPSVSSWTLGSWNFPATDNEEDMERNGEQAPPPSPLPSTPGILAI